MNGCKKEPKCKLGKQCRRIEIWGRPLYQIIDGHDGIWDNKALKYIRKPGDTDIIIIDESPAYQDDKLGSHLPFQSPVGKTIAELCNKAGMDPKRTHLTYLVKCTLPKGNKKPLKKEVDTCFQYLDQEIRALKPKVIMGLGPSFLSLFKIKGNITSNRGTVRNIKWPGWEDGPTFKLVLSLRPSSLFINEDPSFHRRIQGDYNLASKAVTNQTVSSTYQCKYSLIKNLEDARKMIIRLNAAEKFAFDTETRGLEYWNQPLITIQISLGEGDNYVLPWYKTVPSNDETSERIGDWLLKQIWTNEEKATLKTLLRGPFENPQIKKAAHNFKFDFNVLRRHLDLRVQGFKFDTQIAHHILWEKRPHDLETLADLEFNCSDWAEQVYKYVGYGKKKKSYDHIPNDVLYNYGATDAEMTFRLMEVYEKRLKENNQWELYKAEGDPIIEPLADAEYRGCLIDNSICQEQIENYTKQYETIERELQQHPQLWPEFNPSSYDDVSKALIQLGLKDYILDKTKRSGVTTDHNRLISIQDKHEIIPRIVEYRSLVKLVSTYFQSFLEEQDTSGRFHPSFLIHGTETGRLSASRVHQIPRLNEEKTKANIKQPRHIFIVPDGYKYIYLDYSQLELYVMALIAKDQEMLKAIEDDMHTHTAAAFLGESIEQFKLSPYYKYNRSNVGKPVNFAIQYGSEGYQIVRTGTYKTPEGITKGFTWDMYNEGDARWKARFKNTGTFIKETPSSVRNNEAIATSIFSRRRHFGKRLRDPTIWARKRAEREAINHFIQSPAGGITNRTIATIGTHLQYFIYVTKQIKFEDICLINTVHDSIGYECKEYLVDWFVPILKKIATRPIPEFNNFRFPVNVGVGNSWAEAEIDAG